MENGCGQMEQFIPLRHILIAAANIATQWRTFHGASDPGAGNFRVPDLAWS